MIDIHCHILPGIDDGAKDMAEAVQMARLAYDDGIRHIIATPHFHSSLFNDRGIVREKVAQLRQALERESIPVRIYPGNEVRLEDASDFYAHAQKEQFCYLGDSNRYVLLEQSWTQYNDETPEVIRWLTARGTTPIIPHPERHYFFRTDAELLVSLIKQGAWTQVSVDSLLGKNNEEAKSFAHWLIEHDYAHTLATDAHNLNRKPNLALGFAIAEKTAGKKSADQIKQRMEAILQSL